MRIVLFTLGVYLALSLSACSKASAGAENTPAPLPPIALNIYAGVYFTPGCDAARVPERFRSDVATVQEAELSGYRLNPQCSPSDRDSRLKVEHERFGDIQPTAQTEQRKNLLILMQESRR